MDDDEFEEEIYEPVGSASDTNEEDIRVSRIQLSVVKCLHATSRDEDCCRLACSTYTSYIRARVTS